MLLRAGECLDVSEAFLWVTFSLAFINSVYTQSPDKVLARFDNASAQCGRQKWETSALALPNDSFHFRGVLFFYLSVNYFFYVSVIFHCKFSILLSLAVSPAESQRQATP